MAKVKKIARKRTVRNVKVAKKSVKKTKRAAPHKKPTKKRMPVAVRKRPKPVVAAPAVKVDIKELDPIRKCGPGTSVQILLRVIERVDGKSTSHLVFFDKYGWYCDHGPGCPAVAYARKGRRHLAVPTRR
ncbi:MAG: hypothetical protein ABIT20_00105 [Gemmatimonadaceae bacterium]